MTGVDVAPLLLQVAKRRLGSLRQVQLIETDAQALDLPPGSMDAVFSRFGVMGFTNAVVAFTNFHRILKSSRRLAFCCWRSLTENELDSFPLAAAGVRTQVDHTPFSFSDPDYVRHTLEAAGFGEIAIEPHDASVSCGDVDTTMKVLLRVGALGKIVRENPNLRAHVEPRLREALAAIGDPAEVRLTAAVWIVTAQADGTNR